MNNPGRFSQLFGLIFGIIGAALLLPGAIMACVYLTVSNDPDLLIGGGVIAMLGVVFLLIGLVGALAARGQRARAERLMREGRCYEARITRVYENLYINMHHRHPLIVECGYTDEMGKTYLVKSGNIWLSPMLIRKETLKAKVYVNAGDPRDYYVDVYNDAFSDEDGTVYDYDYR